MTQPVIIVGAGWAGLAAGVELARHGIPTLLLEAASQSGGRARGIRVGGYRVDNGQHLFLGAYRTLLECMHRIGVDESRVFKRMPLSLRLRQMERSVFQFHVPGLPAPFHLLAGLCLAHGVGLKDKWRARRFGASFRWRSETDFSVNTLLERICQPHSLRKMLWRPLCLAVLNTAPEEASAEVFVRVLNEAFSTSRRNSDMLVPITDLDRIFPQPALRYIVARGGEIKLNHRVTELVIDNAAVSGLRTKNRWFDAAHVILAVPPRAAARILGPIAGLSNLVHVLNAFDFEPICTVYLHYSKARLQAPFIGLIGGLTQWIFDRRHTGQPNLMAAVISASGPHMALGNKALIQKVAAEIAAHYPVWPAPAGAWVVREKQATFRCSVGINAQRPVNVTPVDGLWLAGDYTATGLPGTLEGAVRSGVNCARAIIERIRQ